MIANAGTLHRRRTRTGLLMCTTSITNCSVVVHPFEKTFHMHGSARRAKSKHHLDSLAQLCMAPAREKGRQQKTFDQRSVASFYGQHRVDPIFCNGQSSFLWRLPNTCCRQCQFVRAHLKLKRFVRRFFFFSTVPNDHIPVKSYTRLRFHGEGPSDHGYDVTRNT